MVKYRSVVGIIILNIVTCGIYSLFWLFAITEELGYLTDDHDFTGGKALLFTIITCGIYQIYWYYVVGRKVSEVQRRHNDYAADNGFLYLILAIFGLSIVSDAIIQSEMNRFA
ncbi:protein of unknown function [Amphibacillus marinus]|uniref:DUF4234 domain-containing protein n=1 Tax=Amphibacillus marinus TaxID=872970 RepID=A0A1H8NA37_9BACI|nr:DUF4234 domain-containing protein [Amphibacillus marinus]SEO26474.1 protein of unknown function [Amphibacillus marinus]